MNTLQEYKEFTPKTFVVPKENALNYLFSGLAAEAGEVCGVYAKYQRFDYDYEEMIKRVEKEIGDVFYFLTQLSNELGLDIEQLILMNKRKLEDRLTRNVIKGDGDNR